MSHRASKRQNRLCVEDGSVPTKRRKRTTQEEEETLASWQPRSSDLKSIYNRTTSEAPAELFRKDLISAMKLPDSEPLAPSEYWVIVDQWKQEWERGVQVPVNPDSLPEPSVMILRSNSKTHKDFKLPKNKYIRITKDDRFQADQHILSHAPTQAEAACSYDLDECDTAWLKIVNGERAMCGLPPIYEDQLERVIERFELCCWDKIQTILRNEEGLGIEYDENVICDVCRSPDSEEGNEMVFCDMCNICVHQACYGITRIPAGQWLCCTCNVSQRRPECVLCPNKGGAMKSTRSGQKWAHVSCALWIPEVSIGCVEKMEPITKISSIPTSRWALICVLCRERVGACIQCSVKTCKTAYHVTCAFKHGLEMRAIIEDENADDGVKLRSYCEKHSKQTIKAAGSSVSHARSTASVTSVDDADAEKISHGNVSSNKAADNRQRKKRKDTMTSEEKNQARALRIQQIEAEFHKHVSLKEAKQLVGVDEQAVHHMYNYWKLKRRSQNNRPLLPPPKCTDDMDSVLAQKREQADLEKMKMFVQLRQDLERVRNLCYMVSRREKLSRTYFRMREQTFHKQVTVLKHLYQQGSTTVQSSTSVTSTSTTVATIQAVIEANHSPSIYDRLYSHCDAKAHSKTEFEHILERIHSYNECVSKNQPAPSGNNGALQINKSNPYKKMYFNGYSSSSRRKSLYASSSSISDEGSNSSTHCNVIKKPPTRAKARELVSVILSSDTDDIKLPQPSSDKSQVQKTKLPAARKRSIIKTSSILTKHEPKAEPSTEEDDTQISKSTNRNQKRPTKFSRSRLKQIASELASEDASDSDDLEPPLDKNKRPIRKRKPQVKKDVKPNISQRTRIYSESDSSISSAHENKSGVSSTSTSTSSCTDDSSSESTSNSTHNEDKSSNSNLSDSQSKRKLRTKASLKDFELKQKQRTASSQPTVSTPNKAPSTPKKSIINRKRNLVGDSPKDNKKVIDLSSNTDLLVVPQRQAAKKATENLKSTTVNNVRHKDTNQTLINEINESNNTTASSKIEDKQKLCIKPKTKMTKETVLTREQLPVHRKEEKRKSDQPADEDVEKPASDLNSDILMAYVPQRQAAKKAAEHIKSGLTKPSTTVNIAVDPDVDKTVIKKETDPQLKGKCPVKTKEASDIARTINKNQIASNVSESAKLPAPCKRSLSCSGSSTSTSSTSASDDDDDDSSTSTSSESSDSVKEVGGRKRCDSLCARTSFESNSDLKKNNTKQLSTGVRQSTAKDWPFLDKGAKPAASICLSDSSDDNVNQPSIPSKANTESAIPTSLNSTKSKCQVDRRKSVSTKNSARTECASSHVGGRTSTASGTGRSPTSAKIATATSASACATTVSVATRTKTSAQQSKSNNRIRNDNVRHGDVSEHGNQGKGKHQQSQTAQPVSTAITNVETKPTSKEIFPPIENADKASLDSIDTAVAANLDIADTKTLACDSVEWKETEASLKTKSTLDRLFGSPDNNIAREQIKSEQTTSQDDNFESSRADSSAIVTTDHSKPEKFVTIPNNTNIQLDKVNDTNTNMLHTIDSLTEFTNNLTDVPNHLNNLDDNNVNKSSQSSEQTENNINDVSKDIHDFDLFDNNTLSHASSPQHCKDGNIKNEDNSFSMFGTADVFHIKEVVKEDSVRETLNLVEKLRMELSKKSSTGICDNLEDTTSASSKNDSDRTDVSEQVVPNAEMANMVTAACSFELPSINSDSSIKQMSQPTSALISHMELPNSEIQNMPMNQQNVAMVSTGDERWVPPSDLLTQALLPPPTPTVDTTDTLHHFTNTMSMINSKPVVLLKNIDKVNVRRSSSSSAMSTSSSSSSSSAATTVSQKTGGSGGCGMQLQSEHSFAICNTETPVETDIQFSSIMPPPPPTSIPQPIYQLNEPFDQISSTNTTNLYQPCLNSQTTSESVATSAMIFPPSTTAGDSFPFGNAFSVLPVPPLLPSALDDTSFASTASFTNSQHNMALTAAMVNLPVTANSLDLESQLRMTAPPPIPILSTETDPIIPAKTPRQRQSVMSEPIKPPPPKPTRSSTRVTSQVNKSPAKSPKTSAQMSNNITEGSRSSRGRGDSKRGSNRGGRGRGRGRGANYRQNMAHTPFHHNTNPDFDIHNKLVGTVYDLDFDDDCDNSTMSDLKSMRDRRRSLDQHHQQSPGASSILSSKSSSSGKTPNNVVDYQTNSDALLAASIVQPVLPGPVDMRTYNTTEFTSSSLQSSSLHTQIEVCGAISRSNSFTSNTKLIEDDDFEKDLLIACQQENKPPEISSVCSNAVTDAFPSTNTDLGTIETSDPLLLPSTLANDSVVSNMKVSLSDSRNQLKVKIKGPISNYSSANSSIPNHHHHHHNALNHEQPVLTPLNSSLNVQSVNQSTPLGSNLRRMRKKELLRQYWTQDMNMDIDGQNSNTSTASIPPALKNPQHQHSLSRAIITIPKAVASMTSIPTKDDYRDYRVGEPKPINTRPLSRELRGLEVSSSAPPSRRRGRPPRNQPVASAEQTNPPASQEDFLERIPSIDEAHEQQAPKIKIKIGVNNSSIVNNNDDASDRKDMPPKKRLTTVNSMPSVEDLKRESMKFRKLVMADFDVEKRKRRDKSHRKKKRREFEPSEQVQIISNESNNPTKLIIRFGKKNNDDDTTTKMSQSGSSSSLSEANPKLTPIKLKLSRCQEGSGYVMSESLPDFLPPTSVDSASIAANDKSNATDGIPTNKHIVEATVSACHKEVSKTDPPTLPAPIKEYPVR